MPFVATMHLIRKLNRKSTRRGLDKTEFSIFVPTLINANQIDEYVERILEFGREKMRISTFVISPKNSMKRL